MGYWTGKVKVVGEDRMCFPAHPKTLEPLACSCYDAWAFTHPETEPVETISIGEWQTRRNQKWDAMMRSNDRVEGRDAASSRRVPSHDGLCGNDSEVGKGGA